jgi:hypothetical protein
MDSIQVVFSATKSATAACANLLVQRGLLDLDAPVVAYWPEYGTNGKDTTLVRWLLTHKAGVLAPQARLTINDLADWDLVVTALAAQTPVWERGPRTATTPRVLDGWSANSCAASMAARSGRSSRRRLRHRPAPTSGSAYPRNRSHGWLRWSLSNRRCRPVWTYPTSIAPLSLGRTKSARSPSTARCRRQRRGRG